MSHFRETSFETFQEDVIAASCNKPILVDLWADWCSPCLVIAPVLEQLADEFKDELVIIKLEVDEGENMKIAGRHQVRGFPTLILFQNGEEQGRFHGAKSLNFMKEFVEQHADFS